jgi:Domain of unknown function (DUF4349)
MSAPEVEQIEEVLRSDVAEPSPAFAAELDRRVAAGFPKSPRPRPVWLRPALAGAAVLVVVAVVALSVVGDDGQRPGSTAAFKALPAPRTVGDAGAASAQLSAPATRRVERDVQLTIAAPQDKLQQTADGVGTVAESHHGFVYSSHVTTGDAGTSGGSFELRVPQRELQATIADLSKLGELRSRSESAQDLTAPFGRTQDRLGNALVERRTLKLRRQTPAVRARIAELNATIDRLNARLRNLRTRTSYSTVDVTLEQSKKGSGAGTGAAFDDARGTLEGMLNFAVRALAVLLPLAVLAALAALAARLLRRRLASRALR